MTIATVAVRQTPGLREAAIGAALAASTAWFALGAESIARPGEESYRDVLLLVPWLLSLASLATFRALFARKLTGGVQRAFAVVFTAMVVLVVGQMGLIVDSAFLKLFALVAMLGFIGGLAAVGMGLWRSGSAPRPVAAALGLTQPLTMALGIPLSPWVPLAETGSYSGAVVHGVTWAILGVYLMRRE